MIAEVTKHTVKTKKVKKPRYSLKMRLRMVKSMDYVLGQWLPKIRKFLLGIVCIALLGWITYLSLQVFGVSLTPADTTQNLPALEDPNRSKDILEVSLSVLTMIITAVTAIQVYLMKDINHMEMSHNIFDDNQHYRKQMDIAHTQLVTLAAQLPRTNDFDTTYLQKNCSILRAFAFHHEYMGYLVFRRRLNFDIVFDTVAFPNWLISSPEGQRVINAGRVKTPDFWNGSNHLYLCYEIRRKYNMVKSLKRELRRRSFFEVQKAKKKWRKHKKYLHFDLPRWSLPTLTTDELVKNLYPAKANFKTACADWKAHFSTMPE